MIFKVQQSLVTSEGQPQMLIYNEDRSVIIQEPISDEVAKFMGDKLKVYVEGRVWEDNIILDRVVPDTEVDF